MQAHNGCSSPHYEDESADKIAGFKHEESALRVFMEMKAEGARVPKMEATWGWKEAFRVK